MSKTVKGIINLSQVGQPKPKSLTKWGLRFQEILMVAIKISRSKSKSQNEEHCHLSAKITIKHRINSLCFRKVSQSRTAAVELHPVRSQGELRGAVFLPELNSH